MPFPFTYICDLLSDLEKLRDSPFLLESPEVLRGMDERDINGWFRSTGASLTAKQQTGLLFSLVYFQSAVQTECTISKLKLSWRRYQKFSGLPRQIPGKVNPRQAW